MDENMDLSGAVEKLKQMMSSEEGQGQLQNIISAFTGMGQGEAKYAENESVYNPEPSQAADNLELLMKMQKIMAAMKSGENNQNVRFLQSLRPFLKPQRQASVDNAVRLMGLSRALSVLKDVKSENGR